MLKFADTLASIYTSSRLSFFSLTKKSIICVGSEEKDHRPGSFSGMIFKSVSNTR